MGIGSAVAVVMQYLLQIQWGVGGTPALPVFMLAANSLLLFILLRMDPQTSTEGGDKVQPAQPRHRRLHLLLPADLLAAGPGHAQPGALAPPSNSRLRWIGEQVGWFLGIVGCLVLLIVLLLLIPLASATSS